MSDRLHPAPQISWLKSIQRHHGLEHATMTLLARRFPGQVFAGYSTPGGFWILGDLPTESIAESVDEAIRRLNNGETELAIHPNCGTNFMVSGMLAGIAGAVAMLGVGHRTRDKLERLPLAIMLATLVLIFSQPLGKLLQERVTTTAELGEIGPIEVIRKQLGQLTLHHVIL